MEKMEWNMPKLMNIGMVENRSMTNTMFSKPEPMMEMITTIDYLMSRDAMLTALEQEGITNTEMWTKAMQMMGGNM